MIRRGWYWLCYGFLTLVVAAVDHPSPEFSFEDVALRVGLGHRTIYGGEQTNRYLLETTGCGAAFFDYDNDSWLDVFLVNGSRLEGFPVGQEPISRLFRNNGDGTFRDVTREAGVARSGWGQAVCVGDYDNDGFDDLFVTYWGQNALFRNQGDGTFVDATAKAGLSQEGRRWNTGCAFLDFDRDGDLDLFVANYIDFEPENTPTPDSGLCLYKGIEVACGPPGLPGGKNLLYLNQGDGTFRDISRQAGITEAHGTYALGVLTADFDNDGWTDIYVANDSNPSALYQNNRDGTFTDIAILAGCAYSQDGKPQAGMGVAAGDVNHNGYLDIFKTNFAGDTANLYLNLGEGFFEEASFATGIGVNTRWLGWGCGLVDFNHDGWLDIFQVNGHVYPEVNRLQTEAQYKQRKVVYLNLKNGRFADVTEIVGGDILKAEAGRGAAFGDFDNDGSVDVLVNNVNDRPNLYRARVHNRNHWVSIRLLGTRTNRSGIGARVRVRAGELELMGEVRSGGSYFSQNQFRLHFGLGQRSQIDRLEVQWLGGELERFENVPANQILYIEEGKGIRTQRASK